MSATAITEAPGEPVVHTCSCSRTFTAAEWSALPYVGTYRDEVETLEMRNCTSCMSTRAIEVPQNHPLPRMVK